MQGCDAIGSADFRPLPDLLRQARLLGQLCAELDTAPARHVRYRREYLGWGVYALMNR